MGGNIKIGSNDILKLKCGSDNVSKFYIGSELVYDNSEPEVPTGIRVNSNNTGLIFPADTYYSVDGYKFYTYYGEDHTTSDSWTLDTEEEFSYSSDTYTIDPSISNGSVTSAWSSTAASTTLQLVSPSLTSYAYAKSASVKHWSTSTNTPYSTLTFKFNGLNVSPQQYAIYPKGIYLKCRSNGSTSSTSYTNGDCSSIVLQIYNTSTNTVVESYNGVFPSWGHENGVNTSMKITFDTANSNRVLTANEEFRFKIDFSTQQTGRGDKSSNSDANIVITNYGSADEWSYINISNPGAVFKIGLNVQVMDYGGTPDTRASITEDSGNHFDLGYIKLSDTEYNKIIQYSKTLIS